MKFPKLSTVAASAAIYLLAAAPVLAANFNVTGIVRDSVTSLPLSGVSVTGTCNVVIPATNNPQITDATGFYSLNFNNANCSSSTSNFVFNNFIALAGTKTGYFPGAGARRGAGTVNFAMAPLPTSTPSPTDVPPTPTDVPPTPTDEPVPTVSPSPTPTEPPVVPEFGVVQGALALLGSAGTYIALKRKSV